LKIEAADAPYGLQRQTQGEVDGKPIAPFANLEDPFLAADDKLRDPLLRIDMDGEVGGEGFVAFPQRVVRAVQGRANGLLLDGDRIDGAARERATTEGKRLGRVERERAVGAEQIRRAHAAQLTRRGP
jgi:hypothetical protein